MSKLDDNLLDFETDPINQLKRIPRTKAGRILVYEHANYEMDNDHVRQLVLDIEDDISSHNRWWAAASGNAQGTGS